MIELVGAAAAVGVPIMGFVLRLQARIAVLETQQEATKDRINGFEERIFDALKELQRTLENKLDRRDHPHRDQQGNR